MFKGISAIHWLIIAALLIAGTVISYLLLHHFYPSQGYFWLNGKGLAAEIIYWSFLGALCPVFAEAGKNAAGDHTSYRKEQLFFEWAALLTAPICALILFAGMFYLRNNDTLDNSFIILSFGAGLLSRNILSLFSNTINTDYKTVTITSVPVKEDHAIWQAEDPEPYGLLYGGKVRVCLYLDNAGLFFDEQKQILVKGLKNASVSMQKDKTGEIIPVELTGNKQQSIFEINNLSLGIYTVRAWQTIRLEDRTFLHLFGEQEVILSKQEQTVMLPVKKFNA